MGIGNEKQLTDVLFSSVCMECLWASQIERVALFGERVQIPVAYDIFNFDNVLSAIKLDCGYKE